jgi:cytochrome c biogenesis protein CcdA
VLVVAFGLGMAAVMAGIGLALVAARDRFERMPVSGGVTRVREAVPLVAGVVVLGFGILLTAQALTALRIPAL